MAMSLGKYQVNSLTLCPRFNLLTMRWTLARANLRAECQERSPQMRDCRTSAATPKHVGRRTNLPTNDPSLTPHLHH